MKYAALAVLLLGLVGCAMTKEERNTIIRQAATEAGQKAYDKAFKEARDRGLAPDEALAFATTAKETTERLVRTALDESLPPATDGGSGGIGRVLTTVLYGLAQVGLGLLKAKGGLA